MTAPALVYILCFLTCALCAGLLVRSLAEDADAPPALGGDQLSCAWRSTTSSLFVDTTLVPAEYGPQLACGSARRRRRHLDPDLRPYLGG